MFAHSRSVNYMRFHSIQETFASSSALTKKIPPKWRKLLEAASSNFIIQGNKDKSKPLYLLSVYLYSAY